MLSGKKLNDICKKQSVNEGQLAEHLAHGGMDKDAAASAIRNWKKGLYTPNPSREDVERLASGLGIEPGAISEWRASCRYAPMSASKVRLVTQMIAGRDVQDALDLLTFTHKRAAPAIKKVLQSAIANADEQEADVDNLYVSEARVDRQADGSGPRHGTLRIAGVLTRFAKKPAIFI